LHQSTFPIISPKNGPKTALVAQTILSAHFVAAHDTEASKNSAAQRVAAGPQEEFIKSKKSITVNSLV
jgi:hypothetical protein